MPERGQRPHRDVEPFERLDAPDEEQHRMVAEPERGPRAAAIARREERVIDTRGHDLDATGCGAVEAVELGGFLGAAREDRVGTAHDLDLGALASLRLLISRLGLDASEGVERRHEREVELVLEAVPGETREPVVRVDDVGAVTALEVVAHPIGERVDGLGQGLLREVGRADVDVTHAEPRLDRDLTGEAIAPRAHVDGAVDSGLGERGYQLAHVHVHPAGISDTGLDKRRRVKRQDGESAHGGVQRS